MKVGQYAILFIAVSIIVIIASFEDACLLFLLTISVPMAIICSLLWYADRDNSINSNTMIAEEIKTKLEEILSEIDKTTNKAACTRTRKRTLEAEKLFKAYRKESVKW